MKKILLLLPFLLFLMSSCATAIKAKKSPEAKQIENNLDVYIAIATGDNKQKPKWAVSFGDKLSEVFASKGIETKVKIFETDVQKKSHDFEAEDIKTTNPNGLTLLIVEENMSQTVSGGMKQSVFSVVLTDHNLGKNVWATEFRTMWGSVGGANAIAGFACKQVTKSMMRDGLLAK